MVKACALLFSAVFAASGQQEAVPAKDFTFSVHSDLVLLDVSVKDAKGGFVSTLKKENFKVFENGKPQSISQFGMEDTPITVGLVLDDSRSMKPKRTDVINAALAFIDGSNPHDEIFVTHFNDHVRRGLPTNVLFTDDPDLLRNALFNNPAQGMTALYDGIVDALHQLELGKQTKKSLILISDGGDNASSHTFKDAMHAALTTQATIYTVGLFDEEDQDRNPGLLRRLATVSGGIAYVPHKIEELTAICRGIAADIRNRYSIGYVPLETGQKGALRTIKVSVNDAGNQKFIVHARTSYLRDVHP